MLFPEGHQCGQYIFIGELERSAHQLGCVQGWLPAPRAQEGGSISRGARCGLSPLSPT